MTFIAKPENIICATSTPSWLQIPELVTLPHPPIHWPLLYEYIPMCTYRISRFIKQHSRWKYPNHYISFFRDLGCTPSCSRVGYKPCTSNRGQCRDNCASPWFNNMLRRKRFVVVLFAKYLFSFLYNLIVSRGGSMIWSLRLPTTTLS